MGKIVHWISLRKMLWILLVAAMAILYVVQEKNNDENKLFRSYCSNSYEGKQVAEYMVSLKQNGYKLHVHEDGDIRFSMMESRLFPELCVVDVEGGVVKKVKLLRSE